MTAKVIPVTEFRQLSKMMALTASESDGEALAAMRAANKVLTKHRLSWADVFGRLVTVDVEEERHETSTVQPSASNQASDIETAFSILAKTDLHGGFEEFIHSLHEQWTKKSWLSVPQREALFKAARRAQERR